jgi:hypothetical protein
LGVQGEYFTSIGGYMKIKTVIFIFVIVSALITLESCSPNVNKSKVTETQASSTSTATLLPSNTTVLTASPTIIPPTNTKEPIIPTFTASKILITNTPITKWNNIPIMKGAYNIANGGTLSYSIKSTVTNVYTYYLNVMKSLGYTIFADSSGGKGKMTI